MFILTSLGGGNTLCHSFSLIYLCTFLTMEKGWCLYQIKKLKSSRPSEFAWKEEARGRSTHAGTPFPPVLCFVVYIIYFLKLILQKWTEELDSKLVGIYIGRRDTLKKWKAGKREVNLDRSDEGRCGVIESVSDGMPPASLLVFRRRQVPRRMRQWPPVYLSF